MLDDELKQKEDLDVKKTDDDDDKVAGDMLGELETLLKVPKSQKQNS